MEGESGSVQNEKRQQKKEFDKEECVCVCLVQCVAMLTGSVDSPVWNSRGFI